jgi:GT2 family glycosyltransferase
MATVSIIIPTYNRLPRLKQVIAAVEKQTYPLDNVEVIVVSDGSTDGTHEYLNTIQTPLNFQFVPQTNAGPAAARNRGIKQASGEYVLFIDDDIVASPELMAEHMRLHTAQPNLIVLGPMLNPHDFALSPWVAWEQAMLKKQYQSMQSGHWPPTARQFYTGNTSLARKYLIEVKGFDERFRRAEDVELAYRLEKQGLSFVFNPNAVGYHYVERSFRSWMETPYAYGHNDVILTHEKEPWILDLIRTEFKDRNPLIQMLIRTSLDRINISNMLIKQLSLVAKTCYGLGIQKVSHAAYSAIFNMRYYQGVSDELGGRTLFFRGKRHS